MYKHSSKNSQKGGGGEAKKKGGVKLRCGCLQNSYTFYSF